METYKDALKKLYYEHGSTPIFEALAEIINEHSNSNKLTKEERDALADFFAWSFKQLLLKG